MSAIRKKPDSEKSQPMMCICKLCDCGVHTCATFDLPTEETQEQVSPDKLGSSKVADGFGQQHRVQAMMTEEKNCGLNRGYSHCECTDEERYLMSEAKLAASSRKPKLSNNIRSGSEKSSEDQLHVLVIRPEIAGKPRDNIICEGDMDLKTTFETSYEALAKQRLDHWRRYQENQYNRDEAKYDRHRGLSFPEDDMFSPESCVEVGPKTGVSVTAKPISLNRKRVTRSSSGSVSGFAPEQISSFKFDGHHEDQIFASEPPSEPERIESTNHDRNHIDPDLSPIIIYDANMNRLEKVGLRKRSKYRPSTSLRSGSKGLFGDQEDDKEPMQRRIRFQSEKQSDLCLTPNSTADPGGGNFQESSLLRAKMNQTPNVRDMLNSNQPEYLVNPNQNSPIDSNRKLKDNIHMTDHIKKQNTIVINENVGGSGQRFSISENQNNLQDETEFKKSILSENLANLKIQQVEPAAVGEMQKTLNPLDLNEISAKFPSNESQNPDSESRQAKLQRTCQHQNFSIFENEYPEPKPGPLKAANHSPDSRQSPRSRSSYNNLFRESPDFMVALPNYLNREVREGRVESDSPPASREEVKDLTEEETHPVYMSAHVDEEDISKQSRCRVLQLGRDFQYVCSKSGHNYFVEKPSTADD